KRMGLRMTAYKCSLWACLSSAACEFVLRAPALSRHQRRHTAAFPRFVVKDDGKRAESCEQLARLEEMRGASRAARKPKLIERVGFEENQAARAQGGSQSWIQGGVAIIKARDDVEARRRQHQILKVCLNPMDSNALLARQRFPPLQASPRTVHSHHAQAAGGEIGAIPARSRRNVQRAAARR